LETIRFGIDCTGMDLVKIIWDGPDCNEFG
jgi:hypothetical protein